MMDKIPKKKIVPINFLCVLFSLLDFLILEAGIDRLFWNVDMELPLRCVISQKNVDLTWQFGAAGLGLTLLGPVQSDPVWCGQVHLFIHEFNMTSYI